MATPEEQAKGWSCLIVCLIIMAIPIVKGLSERGTKKQPTSTEINWKDYNPGRSHSGRNTSARQHLEQMYRERQQKMQQEYQQKQMQQIQQRIQSQLIYSGHSGSPMSNYQQLWDECEDLEAALNDAGIDHVDLSYPMDYHDLEDLRDEYLSLLEENDIDY